MTGPEVLDVARDAIFTLVLVSSPLMLVGLVVGVVISLFQALTQIQEMTLVFVPKILAIFLAMLVALPFMADVMHSPKTKGVPRGYRSQGTREVQRLRPGRVHPPGRHRRLRLRPLLRGPRPRRSRGERRQGAD